MRGERPSRPADAVQLGLVDEIWELLEDCWQTERTRRPSVKDVLSCVTAAAWVCGPLPSVGGIAHRHKNPESHFNFGEPPPVTYRRTLTPHGTDTDVNSEHTHEPYPPSSPLTGSPSTVDRPPSQESTLTDTSTSDSLFSKLSAAESSATEPSKTSTDALGWGSRSKGDDARALTNILFGHPPRKLKHQFYTAVAPC